jgi:hypothetical protein
MVGREIRRESGKPKSGHILDELAGAYSVEPDVVLDLARV